MTFTPCFLWIFLGAPFIERLRGNKALAGALAAITAAVVGVILNLAIWFALHVLFRETTPVHSYGLSFDLPRLYSIDIAASVLAVAAAVAIFRFKLGMIAVLGGACAAGIALRLAGVIRDSPVLGSRTTAGHRSFRPPWGHPRYPARDGGAERLVLSPKRLHEAWVLRSQRSRRGRRARAARRRR